MKELGHLQVYDLILKTRTPLFVGSGKKYVKKEYLFDPKGRRASFLKEDAFFQLLTDRNLEERYEQFMRGEQDNLHAFLTRDCQLRPEEVRSVIRYSVDASDAEVVKDKKREIHGFIRNAAGQVYLPGSSVKGAIRTALLLEKIQAELPEKDTDQRKRVLASRKREKEIPEGRYLNLLELRTRDGKVMDDAVNSIMRGVQISDSLPVPDSQMMLSKKMDVNQDGEAHTITCVRECIRPEVELHLKLTLDQSVCKGSITKDSLLQTVDSFADHYYKTYVEKFRKPLNSVYKEYQNCLILGGGVGFFSKTLAYPYWGAEEALKWVSDRLDRSFPKHHHKSDQEISPRMLKYAQYGGKLYPVMTQHQLVLHTPDGRPMPAVWAYRLYAWLLTRMPREEGDWLHQTGEHPISQFLFYDKDTQQMVWTVNLLCTELETRLSPPLLETNTIDLHGCPISVERQTIRKVPGPEALIFQGREQCRKRVEIRFLTPTAFKQAGRYAIFPQERLLLQSLLGRWNYLCPDYPLTDEDAISALLEGIHIVDYALRTTRYRMKDTAIPGFCGKIQVEAKLPLPLLELWGALVCLAPYGGIGIKTTLGMGGTQISFQRENPASL